MSSHQLTEVYAARDEIDATLVQSMLAEADIEARVVGGQIQGAIGEVPAGLPSAPRVWVFRDSAEAAVALIRAMEEKRRSSWLKNRPSDKNSGEHDVASFGQQLATGVVSGAVQQTDDPTVSGEVWECSSCHEQVTVDFEICWNCQQPQVADEA